jgi:hypothetical protein
MAAMSAQENKKFDALVTPADGFLKLLQEPKRAEYEEILEEGDPEEIVAFLRDQMARLFLPMPSGALAEWEGSDQLEKGTVYVLFHRDTDPKQFGDRVKVEPASWTYKARKRERD